MVTANKYGIAKIKYLVWSWSAACFELLLSIGRKLTIFVLEIPRSSSK